MRKVFGNQSFSCTVKLSLLLLLLTHSTKCISAQRLMGVTTRKWPFIERKLDEADSRSRGDKWIYSGYFVDLLNEIQKLKPDFDYELYFARDGPNELIKMDTLIQQLNEMKADFAITDLTVTDLHEHLVDFTEPFLYTRTSALVHSSHACHLKSLEDLAVQTSVKYGTVAGSVTNYELKTDDPIKHKLFKTIEENRRLLAHNFDDGLSRVNHTKYALITEETLVEYYAQKTSCDLSIIRDNVSHNQRKYAIALKKGSPYLGWFNWAILQLKRNNALDNLRREYFQSDCPVGGDNDDEYNCRSSSGIESTLTEVNAAFNLAKVNLPISLLIIIFIYYQYY